MGEEKYNIQGDMHGSAVGDGATVINNFYPENSSPKLNDEELRTLLQEYRAYLYRTYAELNLRGIALPQVQGKPLDPTRIHIPLEKVYIKLRARPREKQEHPQDEQSLVEHVRRQQEQRRKWEEETHRAEIIAPEEAIRKHAQLVILGPPGAGKTTFLRHLAWARAEDERIPLLVPLGRLDAALEGGHRLLDAALDFLTGNEPKSKLFKVALEQAIAEGKVLWLWDALDEVRTHRKEVIADLEALAAKSYPMVITSRPMGYTSIAGLEAVYDILPLQAEAARAFVERWFRALAEARGVEDAWVKERQQWMERQLDEHPGLREVARNPLMLTFLAVLAGDDPRQDFPRRRKDLYARFVEQLITSWEAWKRGGKEIVLLSGFNDPSEAREIALFGFQRIAWHLHLAYTGKVTQATHRMMKETLAKDLQAELDIQRLKARGLAEKLLDFWQRAGLLDAYILHGVDYLAFRHLTFQEYGAARALAEEYGSDPAALWAELEPHLLEDDWAEVVPLTLAHLEDATPLVEQLLEANAEDEDQQRPLFRAAAALADGADVAEAVKRRVIDGLAQLARTRNRGRKVLFSLDAIAALERMENEAYAAKVLFDLARDKEVDGWQRKQAAEALGRLGKTQESSALLATLVQDKTVKSQVHYAAIHALEELGDIDTLLALARDRTVNGQLRGKIAADLRDDHNREANEIFLALAEDKSLDGRIRVQAAEELGESGWNDEATKLLYTIARDGSVDARARHKAAQALVELDCVEEAAQAWLALAQDEAVEVKARVEAAESLDMLDRLKRIKGTTRAWLAIAQDVTVEARIRKDAAEALADLGLVEKASPVLLALAQDRKVQEDVRIRSAVLLLALAQDEVADDGVSTDATKALTELKHIEKTVPTLLTIALDRAVDGFERAEAAQALTHLGQNKESSQVWLAIAQDETVDEWTRQEAAEALARMGHFEEATQAWLTIAQDNTIGEWPRREAIAALYRLNRMKELQLLTQDKNAAVWVRMEAKRAWDRMERAEKNVPVWLATAQDGLMRRERRKQAIKALAQLKHTEELLILTRDKEVASWVRMEATQALAHLGCVDELLVLAQERTAKAKVRLRAAEALAEMGHIEKAVPILRAITKDRNVPLWRRYQAAKILRRWGYKP